MAIGKNKRMSKGKKGGKKKVGDPFLKKEWYNLRAPSLFQQRNFGKTLVTKSAGTSTSYLQIRLFALRCHRRTWRAGPSASAVEGSISPPLSHSTNC